ncbi:MAG: methyltransferase domain-containing protein [Candidatus Omnitrophica bacterium]|nr:methyltransferase domain-containing protein [Candidatus Omnitrophota bacterium]
MNPRPDVHRSAVETQYDFLSAAYDRRWQRYLSATLGFFAAWLNLNGSETVLDVACGTGALEHLLLSGHPGQKIQGADLSEGMLEQARRRLSNFPNLRFEKADAAALPHGEGAFDVVVCANAFHLFADPASALREMRRVLKPGGRLVLMDWCRDYFFCRFYDFLIKFFRPTQQRCYGLRECSRFLTQAGLQPDSALKFRVGWFWGMMIAQAIRPAAEN